MMENLNFEALIIQDVAIHRPYRPIVCLSLNVLYLVLKLPAETLIDIHISFVGKGGHDDYSSRHSVFGEHHL